MLSAWPENVRRRLRRAVERLEADRAAFLARHPGHRVAEETYAKEAARLAREIFQTYSRRWQRFLRRTGRG